jgi:signal transduction histidine kinase
LQESQLAASRAQQLAALGQLAAGLAHELRNPLTAMKMLVQPMGDQDSIGALDAEDVTVFRQEIDRLEKTIQVFLDYARPPKLEKHPVLIRQLVGETINLVACRSQQKDIRIQSDFPDHPVEVDADAGQLRQVLLNLLLNAVDASPEGESVSVRMLTGSSGQDNGRAQAANEESNWLTIEVADRGCGLPVDLGQRIFEPFVSTKDGGTGLGLPICKRIVKDHGGEIQACNREGGGAVFAVRLPVACRGRPSAAGKNAVPERSA